MAVYLPRKWKGYNWRVRDYTGSPGPCYYDPALVWLDASDKLHMKIAKIGTAWKCSEVATTIPLSFGTYVWTIDTPLNGLDPNIVVGLFPHQSGRKCQYTNELDIEFCKWGSTKQTNRVQYTVQPNYDGTVCNTNTKYPPQGEYYPIRANCSQNEPAKAKPLICTMDWSPDHVAFGGKYTDGEVFTDIAVYRWQTNAGGATPSAGPFRHPWNGTDMPMPVYFGKDTIPQMPMLCMMDLWLTGHSTEDTQAPLNGLEFELVIANFSYTPIKKKMRVNVGVSR